MGQPRWAYQDGSTKMGLAKLTPYKNELCRLPLDTARSAYQVDTIQELALSATFSYWKLTYVISGLIPIQDGPTKMGLPRWAYQDGPTKMGQPRWGNQDGPTKMGLPRWAYQVETIQDGTTKSTKMGLPRWAYQVDTIQERALPATFTANLPLCSLDSLPSWRVWASAREPMLSISLQSG